MGFFKRSEESLGNHELDEGVAGVIPFIQNLTSPIVTANLILDKVPELQSEPNLHKSIIQTVNGNKIGIIGYLTPDTKFLAPKTDVEYEDEIIAIRREVKQLKRKGVNIIIALGHSGFIKDLQIAREVEDLDLVIGGHSNTFLLNSNSTKEIPEIPQGPYPTVIRQSTGRPVLVVQAYAYTKYMGRLHLFFDADGEIIKYDGTPLLLDQVIPKDPDLLEIVNKYRKNVDGISNEVAEGGISYVLLDGDCRLRECNLGDLITDAVLEYANRYYKQYDDVTIAIVQGGRIRASIDRPQKPFATTKGDWMTVLPFSDTLSIVTMNGTILRQMLEHSVSTWRPIDASGQFLQLSGIQVVYDLAKSPGARVVEAKAICSKCGNDYHEIKDSYEYKIYMPSFLAEGGDGFNIFLDLQKEELGFNELDASFDYIKYHSSIDIQVNERIKIVNEDVVDTFPNSFKSEDKIPQIEGPGSNGFKILPVRLRLYLVIIFIFQFS